MRSEISFDFFISYEIHCIFPIVRILKLWFWKKYIQIKIYFYLIGGIHKIKWNYVACMDIQE